MSLLGGDPWRDGAVLHRRLAYVPGDVSLWPELTGGQVIDLLGRLRGGHDPRRRDDLLERFELDPLMEEQFRSLIRDERSDGRTVLLSSHILSEAEALCDRISIIRQGVTVETGTLADLRHLTRVSVKADVARRPDLNAIPGVHDLVVEDM